MIKKKHILFLPEWYPNPEDVQLGIFVEKYARAAALHHNVTLIYCKPLAGVTDYKIYIDNSKGFLEIKCFYPQTKNKLKAYKNFVQAHFRAYEIMTSKKAQPDICHLHMLFRNYVIYKKLYKKTPMILTEQWSGYLNGNFLKLSFLKKRYYYKAFNNAIKITAVSHILKQSLTTIFNNQNIHVLPNIVEKKEIESKTDSNKIKILVVGDLVDNVKNISGIIAAYVNAKITGQSQLTIIGDGIDRNKLEKMAMQLAEQHKKIIFTGRLNNNMVLENMSQNNFLITNSFHETFSMVTAEALLAGIPVICSRCGGPEEFLNSENAILIDVNNNEQLKNAIEKMCYTYMNYDKKQLSAPVIEKFGIEAIGKQLQQLYQI